MKNEKKLVKVGSATGTTSSYIQRNEQFIFINCCCLKVFTYLHRHMYTKTDGTSKRKKRTNNV